MNEKDYSDISHNSSISDPFLTFELVREELSNRGHEISGQVVEEGISAYVGPDDFRKVADFIVNEYIPNFHEYTSGHNVILFSN